MTEVLPEQQFDWDDYEEPEGIELTVPQTKFTLSNCKFPLFLAGFGSGKSLCMAVNILSDLEYGYLKGNTWIPANIGAYAPTYDLLSLITVPYIEELLSLSNIPYQYNKSSHIFDVENYGNIICRSLDNPGRIVGYQVFRSHIDEIDTIEKKKILMAWQKIMSRNRQKIYILDENQRKIFLKFAENGKPIFKTHLNRVSAYTTPEGFQFCYETWEKDPKAKEKGYEIFRASTYSNQHNLPDDYIDTLRSNYPAELVDAYIMGYFVNLVGGSVYPQFDRDKNRSYETVQEKEDIYVGMDFNVMKGASVVHVLRNGNPHAVDEIFNAYDTDEQIEYLVQNYKNGREINVYPDAAGKNRTASNTVETDIAKLEAAGFNVHYDYSNPPIKDRVYSMQAMFCNGHGERRYFVNIDKCPEYTACLEQQIWGDNGLPDKKAGLDHAPDGAGYYIYQEFPIIKPTSNVTVVRGRY